MSQPGAILITQCLQNDFVRLIDKYERLPNLLHVGYDESRRLLGERVEEGPVQSLIEWAYSRSADELSIIHIRDWHNPGDPSQQEHLKQFGNHCIANEDGANFVFETESRSSRHTIVNASGLNDFVDTDLDRVLAPFKGKKMRVGIAGVWTEAKVTFLSYDLRTRYPEFDLAVASPVTASSSRQMHFISLDQLKSILGVRVFSSLGAFTEFLAGSIPDIASKTPFREGVLNLESNYQISDTDKSLLSYLYRDCKRADFKCLDGGFSGNVVLKTKSIDVLGHGQVPTVVKIGARDPIAQERTAFERIEEVLGNNAPRIVDFAELGDRGAIKYRYAAMLEGAVQVFQDFYEGVSNDLTNKRKNPTEADTKQVFEILATVFGQQLGKLYQAGDFERLNLLEYYDFSNKYAPGVRRRVEKIMQFAAPHNQTWDHYYGRSIHNVCEFYEKDLAHLSSGRSHARLSFVHGDLNGRNIVLDPSHNVWIIDFFHAHRGHILRDLLKLENDLLYIFTKIESVAELEDAIRLSTALIGQRDLGIPPDPDAMQFSTPRLNLCYQTACKLRSFYPDLVQADREPFQTYVGLLRYAMHTLSFDESTELQRQWALYSGSLLIEKLKDSVARTNRLRIDFIEEDRRGYGKIGLTILPGRKDRDRDLADDLHVIRESGAESVLCLITENEFSQYGVPDLKQRYADAGFNVRYMPIVDQATPTADAMKETTAWMEQSLRAGKNVLVHCVGGLGRSGLAAASYLTLEKGINPDEAIEIVRETRPRAIETRKQEDFVRGLRAS